MNDTLAYLRGHRLWVVRDFVVWGSLSAYEFSFLISEYDQANKRILFATFPLGGDLQKVNYAELVDFRGNNLPTTINNAKVMVFPKSGAGVVLVGSEGAESFTIAKTDSVDLNGICDLVVIEVG